MPWRLPSICIWSARISVLYFSTPALVGPLAGAQAAFHIHLRALAQVLAHDFGQAAVEDHAVPFGGFAHFAGLLVFPLVGGGNRHVGHLVATGKVRISGSRPRLPTMMTLLMDAMVVSLP
jgi:hypothetical protein